MGCSYYLSALVQEDVLNQRPYLIITKNFPISRMSPHKLIQCRNSPYYIFISENVSMARIGSPISIQIGRHCIQQEYHPIFVAYCFGSNRNRLIIVA